VYASGKIYLFLYEIKGKIKIKEKDRLISYSSLDSASIVDPDQHPDLHESASVGNLDPDSDQHPHQGDKPDPDPDPHQSVKLDPKNFY
jgi:hypothetical protein